MTSSTPAARVDPSDQIAEDTPPQKGQKRSPDDPIPIDLEPTSLEELRQKHHKIMKFTTDLYKLYQDIEKGFPPSFKELLLLLVFDLEYQGRSREILTDICQIENRMERFARLFMISDKMNPVLQQAIRKEFEIWLSTTPPSPTLSPKMPPSMVPRPPSVYPTVVPKPPPLTHPFPMPKPPPVGPALAKSAPVPLPPSNLPEIISKRDKYKTVNPNSIPCIYLRSTGKLRIIFEEIVFTVPVNTKEINRCSLVFPCFGTISTSLIKVSVVENNRVGYYLSIDSLDEDATTINSQTTIGTITLQQGDLTVLELDNIKLHIIQFVN